MELPKSKWGFLKEGTRFISRLPFLYVSYSRNHAVNTFPLSVDINITDRCNFRCKHCRGVIPDYSPKEEMDWVIIRKIIDEMRVMNIPYLSIGGGEPLLRYDLIVQTIEYAKKYGIGVGIVTNGALLDENKLNELANVGIHRIAISLDGATKETHDYIRMPGSFDHIMTVLSLCQNIRQENRFRLHINTVVTKSNFEQLMEITHIAEKYHATAFFQPVGIPQVYDLSNRTFSPTKGVDEFVINSEDLSRLEKKIEELIDFKKSQGVVGNLIWQLSNIVTYYKGLEEGKPLSPFKCYAGFNTIHIDSDGGLSSCIFMPSIGNVRDISLRQAWLSEGYNAHRKLIKRCDRLCALNCYYPISLPGLIYEFGYLPIKHAIR